MGTCPKTEPVCPFIGVYTYQGTCGGTVLSAVMPPLGRTQCSLYALCSVDLPLEFPGSQPLPASLEASSDVRVQESRAAYASVPAGPEAATQHTSSPVTPNGDTRRPAVVRPKVLPSSSPPNAFLKPKVPSLRDREGEGEILSLRGTL